MAQNAEHIWTVYRAGLATIVYGNGTSYYIYWDALKYEKYLPLRVHMEFLPNF